MDLRSLLNNAQSSLTNSYDHSVDQLIDRLGLERQRSQSDSILPALGIFSAGLAVGAILGLVFAPKRGEELRGDINGQIDVLRERMDMLSEKSRRQYEDLRNRGAELLDSAKSKIPTASEVEHVAKKAVRKAEFEAEKLGDKAHDVVDSAEEKAHDMAKKAARAVEKGVDAVKKAEESAMHKVEDAAAKFKE